MGQWRALVDLPASVQTPACARGVTDSVLRGWGHENLIDSAQLVVSELVTNALRHAPGADTYELELLRVEGGVRIYLADGTSIKPMIRELDHRAPRGRGMRIVAAIAADWGSDEHHGGKRVWVELRDDSLGDN